MKKLLVLVIPLLGSHLIVIAQGENWDTYLAIVKGKPSSVLVDMGARIISPDRKLPYLVITGPHAQNCNTKNGMPSVSEIPELETLLDATTGYLAGVTARKVVGTVTYNCERLNYYYVSDTTSVRTAINRMYNTNYKDRAFTLRITSDPSWGVYNNYLYPDSVTKLTMECNKIITTQLQKGNDIKKAQSILYSLGFLSDTGMQSFDYWATANGFKTIKTNKSNSFGTLWEITIEKSILLSTDSLIANLSKIKGNAKTHGGHVKNWGATQE